MFGSSKKTASKVGTLDLGKRFVRESSFDPHEYDDVKAETELLKAKTEEADAKEPVEDKEPDDVVSQMEANLFAGLGEQTEEAPCEPAEETDGKEAQFVVPEGAELLGTKQEVAEAFAAAALSAPKAEETKKEEPLLPEDEDGEIEYVDTLEGKDELTENKTDIANDAPGENTDDKASSDEKVSDEEDGKKALDEDGKFPLRNNDFLDGADEAGYELPDDETEAADAVPDSKEPDKEAEEKNTAEKPNIEVSKEPSDKEKKKEDKKRRTSQKDEENSAGLSGLLDGENRKVVFSHFDKVFADGKKVADAVFENEQAIEKFITDVLGVKKTVAEGYYGGYKYRAIMPPVAVSGATISFEAYPKEKATLDDLFGYDVITKEALEFLGREIEKGESVIVVGKGSTGRTSLLERLCGYVQSNDAFFASVEEDRNEIDFKDKDVLKAVASAEYGISSEELIREFVSQGANTLAVGEISRKNASAVYGLLKNKVQLLACALGDAETAGKFINTVAKNTDMKNAEFAEAFENGCIVVNIKPYAGKVYKVSSISRVGKDAQDDSRIRFDTVFSRKNGDLERASERGKEE